MLSHWIATWPLDKRVAVADAVFLRELSGAQLEERNELRRKRDHGLHALAAAALTALIAVLGASALPADGRPLSQTLAYAVSFLTGSLGCAAFGSFLSWFEPALRRKAPSKRFIIGPDDAGDYHDQEAQSLQRDWVEDNAHVGIPQALQWRFTAFGIWSSLILSAIFIALGIWLAVRG